MKKLALLMAILMCLTSFTACLLSDDDIYDEDENENENENEDEDEDENEDEKPEVKIAKNVTVTFRIPRSTYDDEGNEVPLYDKDGELVYETKFNYTIPKLRGDTKINDPYSGRIGL